MAREDPRVPAPAARSGYAVLTESTPPPSSRRRKRGADGTTTHERKGGRSPPLLSRDASAVSDPASASSNASAAEMAAVARVQQVPPLPAPTLVVVVVGVVGATAPLVAWIQVPFCEFAISPHISPYLPISPHISRRSPFVSLPASPPTTSHSSSTRPSPPATCMRHFLDTS